MFINWLKKYWFCCCLTVIFLLVGFSYVSNVFYYNTYWAYDGGAHVDYILTIAKDSRLPTMAENYLAWHEPLYYFGAGLLAKLLFFLNILEPTILKILQLLSAVFGLLFMVGSGLLAWLVSKRNKLVTILVFLMTTVWPELSEASRYISNEIVFQSLSVWWLVWFFYWQMYRIECWTYFRWILLALGLVVLLWIKLTAVILILGLLVWLVFLAIKEKKITPVITGLLFLVICLIGFSPWLIYKHQQFGQTFTINNFEKNESGKRMPLDFYTSWDGGIMIRPFWLAGTKSFWSMLYADSLGDYYNIFQNYNSAGIKITTINNRQVGLEYYAKSLVIFWLSLPLVVYLLVGLLVYLWQFVKNKFAADGAFLLVILFGLVFGLIFNTYKYPFLERGTMKAIFILGAVPLFLLISISGWQQFKNKILLSIAVVYVIIWSLGCLIINWL